MITKEEIIHILDVDRNSGRKIYKFVYPHIYENFLDIIMGFEDEDVLEESTE